MHRPVCITYDSTCDLTPQLLERFQIRTVPLTIRSGEKTFPDDGSYTAADLYAGYRKDGTLPKTTAVSPEDFRRFFAPILEEGYDIVHIDISSELSCTCQNALLAAQELAELGEIHVVDSRQGAAPSGAPQRHQLCAGHAGVYVERRPMQRRDGAGRQYAEAEAQP